MFRRIIFHFSLNEDQSSLINQVFQAQNQIPSKNYFILGAYISSSRRYQEFVRNNRKESHSKVKHIQPMDIRMQEYFQPKNVRSTQLTTFLFRA